MLRYRSLWAGSILSVVVGMALYGALFAVPIFAQSVLHYTSQQTGMLLLPGALASAFAHADRRRSSLGKLRSARRSSWRRAACSSSALLHARRASARRPARDDLFWPLIVRAFGTVLMFLPLSMATLGPDPEEGHRGGDRLLQPHAAARRQHRRGAA